MRKTWSCVLTGVTCLVATSGNASADVIAYDTITGVQMNPTTMFVTAPFQATDTTLQTAGGLTVTRVDLAVHHWGGSPFETWNGTMTLALYTSAIAPGSPGPTPGVLLGGATQTISIERGAGQLISFTGLHVEVPAPNIWTAWYFMRNGTFADAHNLFVRQTASPPSPGLTTSMQANNQAPPAGSWGLLHAPERNYMVRISTIPAPASAGILLLGLALSRRRSRLGQ